MAKQEFHIRPLVTRAELRVSQDVDEALGVIKNEAGAAGRRQAAQAFAAEVEEGRASYGGMLARVWKEAKRTLDEVESTDDLPLQKRIAALRDLGKLLPMLAKAEAMHKARIGERNIEDMSDRQLEREYKVLKQRKAGKKARPRSRAPEQS